MLPVVDTIEKSKDIAMDRLGNRTNYLIQKCTFCRKLIDLREGGTIYGENWYHNDCWALFKKMDLSTERKEKITC